MYDIGALIAFGGFLLLIFLLVISYYTATQFYKVAVMKGHPEKRYFWICFWLTLPGWILVAALPDRTKDGAAGKAGGFEFDELPKL